MDDYSAHGQHEFDRSGRDDTSPEARRFLLRRYAEMSLAEKAELMKAITRAANEMALAGLRRRHPSATDQQLLLELARLRLGDDLVDRVYGAAGHLG